MKIETITLTELKGLSKEILLAGRSAFITGSNMAGKTAILDGLELALTGAHSRIGKSAAALAKLASDPEGFSAVVHWMGIRTPSRFDLEIVRGTNKIKHRPGPAEGVPLYQISPEAFDRLTSAAQNAIVSDLIDNTMTAAEVLGIMEEVEGRVSKEIRRTFKAALPKGIVDFEEGGAVSKITKELSKVRLSENAVALQIEKQTAQEPPGEAIPSSLVDQYRTRLSDLQEEARQQQSRLDEMNRAWGAFRVHQDELGRLRKIIKDHEATGGQDQEEAKELLHALRQDAQDALKAIRTLEGEISTLQSLKDAVDLEGPCPICRSETPNWRQKARENLEGQIGAKLALVKTFKTRLQAVQEEAKPLVEVVNRPSLDVDRIREKIKELEEIQEPAGDPDQVQLSIMDNQKARTDLEIRIREAEQIRKARQAQMDKGDESALHRGAAALAGQIEEALRMTDRKRSSAKIGEILDVANEILGDVLPGGLVWDSGGLAYVTERGDRIDSSTWSGTETLLGKTAWTAAIAVDSPIKILVLDEFGRLAWDLQSRVLKNLLSLVEKGTIDQFLVVSSGPCPISDAPGLKEILLQGAELPIHNQDGEVVAVAKLGKEKGPFCPNGKHSWSWFERKEEPGVRPAFAGYVCQKCGVHRNEINSRGEENGPEEAGAPDGSNLSTQADKASEKPTSKRSKATSKTKGK